MKAYPLEFDQEFEVQLGWFFTLLFYVIWNYVLVGIVTGQIVTAFSTIRDREEASTRNEDLTPNP